MEKQTIKSALMPILMGSSLLLAGCVSLGSKAPPSLLVLTSAATVDDGTANIGAQKDALIVLAPLVPRKLDTNRLPVQISGSSLAYLKDAVWADKPARLMQQLLMETIAAKNNRLVLNEADAGGQAQEFLSGNLIEFGVDARRNEAIIIYDAVKIVRGEAVKKQRFAVRKPVSLIEPVPVSAALNLAANEIAAEISIWIKS